jgi:hypothetical protein
MERARIQPKERQAAIWTNLEAYPTLRAAALARATGHRRSPHSSFEHGLGLLIAGLRLRHAEVQRANDAATDGASRPPPG